LIDLNWYILISISNVSIREMIIRLKVEITFITGDVTEVKDAVAMVMVAMVSSIAKVQSVAMLPDLRQSFSFWCLYWVNQISSDTHHGHLR
jgi:hypothetical protein